MRLEIANFPVRKCRFDSQTRYKNGELTINKKAILELILQDKRIETVDINVALPGDKTRIALVREVVEPRIKVEGAGCVFPGVLGEIETVGSGRTHALTGVSVITTAKYRATLLEGYGAQDSSIVDMWGPGQNYSPLGQMINVVLSLKLVDGVSEVDAHKSIQNCCLNIGRSLAETTLTEKPESAEVFTLGEADKSLPRIVYILAAVTQHPHPHSGIALYGLPITESLPTLLHPNEFLDGAFTTDARHGSSAGTITWGWMNHPVVLELLRRHGKEVNLVGLILQRTRFTSEHGKKVSAILTAQMAKLLGAEGAILTGMVPSGNNFMDVMFTLQACEKKGIKTVLITPEWGTSESEFPLPFQVPEAVSIISSGNWTREISNLPKPDKVFGVEPGEAVTALWGDRPFVPSEEINLTGFHAFADGADWWGRMKFACREY